MKTKLTLACVFVFFSLHASAQGGWSICNVPSQLSNRVNEIFMLDTQTGYGVCGQHIIKTTDGGNNWNIVNTDAVSCRSVEFINTQKGFVGAFSQSNPTKILRRTVDGGANWTDLTPLLDPRARGGICGLAIPDSNTIYGCGNWFQDSAYIVKSIDGGNTWSFIDMHAYAASLIDMHFQDKDTGFAVGRGVLPLQTAVILYTTDGGQSWTYKFQNNVPSEYGWKIQRLTDQVYFASIQDMSSATQRIVKSMDGGMTWNVHLVPFPPTGNGIQGIGFIDTLKGWTGGGLTKSYESNDGGITWDTISVCPGMNKVIKVNDTLLLASGFGIWKYSTSVTGISPPLLQVPVYGSVNCYPNPASKNLNIDLTLQKSTRALVVLLDAKGRRLKVIENSDKQKGDYQYRLDTSALNSGIYYVVLKTHEDDQAVQVVVTHE